MDKFVKVKEEDEYYNGCLKTISAIGTQPVGDCESSSIECREEDIDIKEEPLDISAVSNNKKYLLLLLLSQVGQYD